MGSKEAQATDNDYKIIKKCRKIDVFPKIYWRGIRKGQMYNVEELVGPSLQEVFTKYQQSHFSASTIALIGLQVLKKLQSLHKVGVTHNGLTPSKILLSYKITETNLYLVGLRDARKTHKLSKLGDGGPLIEKPIRITPFSALAVHLNAYPSKKDDLECLGYILAYFFLGGKLWENFKDKQNTMDKLIEKAKLHLTPELFCEKMPKEMVEYFKYIKGLQPTEKPDYVKLNKLFRSILVSHSTSKVLRYDWMEKAAKKFEELQKKEQGMKNHSASSDANTSAENKPLGAIDIDKDKNFEIQEDSDDDESNLEEAFSCEILSEEQDALPRSIARINENFNSIFIKDIALSSPGRESPPRLKLTKKT
jgi:serine/threonine protein kinase